MSRSVHRASEGRPEDASPGGAEECRRCGTNLPPNANYCLRCGERRGGEGPRPDAAPAGEIETCRIVLWNGYVESRFYAVPVGAGVPPAQLGSARFRRWSSKPPEQEGRALGAYEQLVERLQRDGWEPFAHGARWYETRFRREPASFNGSTPPPRLPAPPLPPGLREARPERPKT